DAREVLGLERDQHDVRADAGALGVIGDAHSVLLELQAAGLRNLRNRNLRGRRNLRAEQPPQERLTHEPATDDADAHVSACLFCAWLPFRAYPLAPSNSSGSAPGPHARSPK